jgi:hypothetical protein
MYSTLYVLAVIFVQHGCLPNTCRTGLDPGRCQSPVGRRSRQLLAPTAVAAVAAAAAAAGPAASGAAATSVFWRKCSRLPPKKSSVREKSAKLLYYKKSKQEVVAKMLSKLPRMNWKICKIISQRYMYSTGLALIK